MVFSSTQLGTKSSTNPTHIQFNPLTQYIVVTAHANFS